MRSVLAVTAVGLALIVAGLTGDPRALVPGALVALGLAGWARPRHANTPVRTPRRPS